jgi:hypothetical protein
MRASTVVAWLLGVGLLVALIALNHPAGVLAALAALGVWFPLAIAFHGVPLLLDVVAWQRLFAAPPRLSALFRIRWIAEGMNGLFPVPHLGEFLRAQLARRITHTGEAGASVVVDLTLGVATQLLFAAFGLALFGVVYGGSPLLRSLLLAIAIPPSALPASTFSSVPASSRLPRPSCDAWRRRRGAGSRSRMRRRWTAGSARSICVAKSWC